MGMLTDPNMSKNNIGVLLNRYGCPLSWLLFIAGIGMFFVLPHPEFSHQTYFSENALLPGLVRGEFDERIAVGRFLDGLRDEATKYPDSVPFPWLEATLRQMGLEVYTHNFTVRHPLSGATSSGKNLYAILRAPRASSTEALVLSVPYRAPGGLEKETDASIGVLLASAKFFQRQFYWAKDIIFLITQHEQLGMQAWLEAYHGSSCGQNGVLDHGELEARAGSIQAAINLEMSGKKISHFNVRIEGLNGQLPNLDLVNLVNRLCFREGIGHLFQGYEAHPRPHTWKGYKRSLKTLTSMMMKQATGVPSGNHGLFHRFGIEALTMEGVYKRRSNWNDVDFISVCRVVEGIFRSLNNLLERFHQSFFFYLLPSSNRYVSIGMYMPAFGLLGGSILLTALQLWFDCLKDENEQIKNQASNGNDSDDHCLPPVVWPSQCLSILPTWILGHAMGLLLIYLPELMHPIGKKFELNTEESVCYGIFAFCLCMMILPKTYFRSASLTSENWKILKCIILIELSAILSTLSLANFSLAYMITAISAPICLVMSPSTSLLKRILKLSLCLLVNPLVFVTILCSVDNFFYTDVFDLGNFLAATRSAIMYSIVDSYIYGNVSYMVLAGCLMPNWFCLWCLNFTSQSHQTSDTALKKKRQ